MVRPVPTRPVRSRWNSRRVVRAALALCLWATAAFGSDAGKPVALSLPQARDLAVEALNTGNPGLAVQVARGLLQANPNDPFAHYVIATAAARLDRPAESRKAAARAYRASEDTQVRFRSAQLAAKMAYTENRLSLAQLWLRRSAINAPDAEAEAVVARDYAVLRRANPWAFRLRTDLRPSSNVNKGADTALQIIDGVPVTGYLSGSAQALSGLIGSLDIAARYRVRANGQSATSLGARFYAQRVALSEEARAQAPSAQNSDFASTYLEASVDHAFALGENGQAGLEAAYGESWYAGARSFRFARVGASRSWRTGRDFWTLNGLFERRFDAPYSVNDAQVWGLGGVWKRPLASGDRLTLAFAVRDSDAAHVNGTYRSGSLRANYRFGRMIGPVRLSAGLVLGYSDYPNFLSGGFISVPGGRQDRSVYGDIGMMFSDFDYAGFAPMLRLRAGRKTSNDTRYSTREFSLSLSFESKF